jgi:type VI secretion system protein VasG
MKGEFEIRLRQVIDEVQASSEPIILFIDEAHTLIGAGGAAGTGDAANLLKPALARGTLRTIAATTWAEYKRHIEKDPALTRRFQVVQVGEPDEDKALLMMRNTAAALEKHHQVLILDEALAAAVKLSHRYIPARQLPDKAVSLLDTACARVACSQHAVPAAIDDCRRRLAALDTELEIVRRELGLGVAGADERETALLGQLESQRRTQSQLDAQWAGERDLVVRILDRRAKLRTPGEAKGRAVWLAELREAHDELAKLQGDRPLILPTVDQQAVAQVVGDWTGIPVGRMVKDELATVMNLAATLSQRVMGQNHALEMLARRIQTSRAGLEDPRKPIGVFLLAGPSGVGKTETALALAETLYGGEHNVITINMSEFQEPHTVSTLKGSPPGYVGYGEGGVLTEAVRRRPYSVVLLDEVEKAHPDVHELFFQVFDKGWMEDGEGRAIDFRNTVILLTTNVGSETIARLAGDPQNLPAPEDLAQALRAPLLRAFPAALLGRMVTIPYYPLSDSMIGDITRLQLARIAKRLQESHGIPFLYDDAVVDLIVSRCTEVESGGRMVDAILTNTLLPSISQEVLTRMLDGRPITRVAVSVADNTFHYEVGAPGSAIPLAASG